MADARLLRRVMHTPDDMMGLVSNVEAYPEFITLLSALRVLNRKSITDAHERFEADATVSYKFIRETFRSVVNIYHDQHKIVVQKASQGGALRSLDNHWTFHTLSDGSTLVDFTIEVKLKAFPLEMLLREKFDAAGRYIMNHFETRAAQVYKKVGDPGLDMDAEYQRLGLSGVSA